MRTKNRTSVFTPASAVWTCVGSPRQVLAAAPVSTSQPLLYWRCTTERLWWRSGRAATLTSLDTRNHAVTALPPLCRVGKAFLCVCCLHPGVVSDAPSRLLSHTFWSNLVQASVGPLQLRFRPSSVLINMRIIEAESPGTPQTLNAFCWTRVSTGRWPTHRRLCVNTAFFVSCEHLWTLTLLACQRAPLTDTNK